MSCDVAKSEKVLFTFRSYIFSVKEHQYLHEAVLKRDNVESLISYPIFKMPFCDGISSKGVFPSSWVHFLHIHSSGICINKNLPYTFLRVIFEGWWYSWDRHQCAWALPTVLISNSIWDGSLSIGQSKLLKVSPLSLCFPLISASAFKTRRAQRKSKIIVRTSKKRRVEQETK